jgi:hypothetical protein
VGGDLKSFPDYRDFIGRHSFWDVLHCNLAYLFKNLLDSPLNGRVGEDKESPGFDLVFCQHLEKIVKEELKGGTQ